MKVMWNIFSSILAARSLTDTFDIPDACGGMGAISSTPPWPHVLDQCIRIQELRLTLPRSRYVALVFSTASNNALLCNLLLSASRLHPPLHVLTISLDVATHTYLQHIEKPSILYNISSEETDVRFESGSKKQYQLISLARQLFIYWVLKLDRSVVSLDTDILFHSNILMHVSQDYDMYAQKSSCKPFSHCLPICAGFLIYNANYKTLAAVQLSIDYIIQGAIHQNAIKKGIGRVGIKLHIFEHYVVPHLNELYGCGVTPFNRSFPVAVHGALRSGGCGVRFEEQTSNAKIVQMKQFGIFDRSCG